MASVTLTETNTALWARAQELQLDTNTIRTTLKAVLPRLKYAIVDRLNPVTINRVSFEWQCEFDLGGSIGHNVAVATQANDLDLLVVVKPDARVLLSGSRCSLQTPRGDCALDNMSLKAMWTAFHEAVKEFALQHRERLVLGTPQEVAPGELVATGTETGQMRCTLLMNTTPVDLLLSFRTSSDVHLVLRRTVSSNGENVVKSFSNLAADFLNTLPDAARHLICALKHLVKVVRGIKHAPGCLFESIVYEVFRSHGWIGSTGEEEQPYLMFHSLWRECWIVVARWGTVYALNAEPHSSENLFTRIEIKDAKREEQYQQELATGAARETLALPLATKNQLIALADRFTQESFGEEALLGELLSEADADTR